MMEAEAYRTDDLTLATVLAMGGYAYTLKALTRSKAIWVFTHPSEKEEEFDDLLDDYDGFKHQVEPREFILKFAEMRKELFAALPHSRRSGAPAPSATA